MEFEDWEEGDKQPVPTIKQELENAVQSARRKRIKKIKTSRYNTA